MARPVWVRLLRYLHREDYATGVRSLPLSARLANDEHERPKTGRASQRPSYLRDKDTLSARYDRLYLAFFKFENRIRLLL